MTRIEAIRELIHEAGRTRLTIAGLKRARRVGKALGLTDAEQSDLEYFLEYRNPNRELHPQFRREGRS